MCVERNVLLQNPKKYFSINVSHCVGVVGVYRMQRLSTVSKMDGKSLLESFRSVIPPQTFSSYKGQSGRIAVVGGSTE